MGAYGGGPSLQPRRGVVQGPRDGTIDAMADLGETIGKIGSQIQDREDKLNYAAAKTQYLKSKIQIESEFENDQDYQTYGDRYKEKISKARGDAVAMIRNPMMRESFQFDTDVDIEQGLAGMAKKAFAKEKDNGRAKLSGLLDESQKLITSTGDPLIRKSAYENVNASVDSAIENNWLSQEEGVNLKRKFAEESAILEIRSKSPEEQLQMLKDSHPALQFVPADKKRDIEETAKSSINSRYFLQKRFEAEQRKEIYFDMANRLEESHGDLGAIDGNAFQMLTPEQQDRIRTKSKKLQNGSYNVTDVTKYHDLKNMAANPASRQVFLEKDMTVEVDDFAPTERKELIDLQAELRNKDPETEKMLDGYRSIGQRLNDTLTDAGFKARPAPGTDDAKSLARLRDSLDKSLVREKQRLGKKDLSYEEEQRIIDRELIKYREPGWFGSKEKFLFQVSPDDISEEDRAKIIEALAAQNIEATEDNIMGMYKLKLMKGGENGR
jgi:hypothetical protein